MYKVEWKDEATESLEKFGKIIARKIRDRVENHLAKNPTQFSKPLKGTLRGLWRYRCYDKYRVIYQLLSTKLIITIVEVGLRKNIYKKLEN